MKSVCKKSGQLRAHWFGAPGSSYAIAATLWICFGSAQAAVVNWKPGTTGNFNAGTNWDTGSVPGAADTAKIDNSGDNAGGSTVNFVPGDTFTVTMLDVGASNLNNNKPVFNQSGGTLNTGTLFIGHPGYGASKSPVYNLSGGTLNVSSAVNFGNGAQGLALNLSGTSVLNYTGTTGMIVGAGGGSNALTLADSAAFNYNSNAQITIGGGSGASVGRVSLSNNSSFTANSVQIILMGNDGSRNDSVQLTDNAKFSAPQATFALSQWNNGDGQVPAIAAGTLTLSDAATFTVKTLKLGGNNLGNPQYSIVYLDGGTIESGSILIGSSTTPADAIHNAVHCNGTIRALADGNNADYFAGTYVDLGAGGLKFDTNANDVSIPEVLHHDSTLGDVKDGGLEKLGEGTLFLNGYNTYNGPTVVSKGTLVLNSDYLSDSAGVTIKDGAVLDLEHQLQDRVASLTIGSTVHTSGVWGSSASGAPNTDDVHFSGMGRIQVGNSTYVPRNLSWNGATDTFWDTGIAANWATTPATGPQTFQTFDNVTFGNPSAPGTTTVDIFGSVQPGSVTFTNTAGNDYVVTAFSSGIGGLGGITKNGDGNVTLGGDNSTFTGPVAVNAGRLTAGGNKAFGNSSGIIIANGAQVDLNGMQPGAIYSFTAGGTAPNGAGIIVNGGVQRFADGGIRDLTLTANTSVGNDGSRFDIGSGGVLKGNGFTLTKIGANDMALRADASGSPIQIVVAGGALWAENQDTAFGGPGGLVTVKSGARAGSYGTLNLSTPVTIESGGKIYNQGNGTTTWSGAISLQGTAGMDSGGGAILVTGQVGGTGSLTKTGTNIVTLSSPAYSGDTTVSQGQLTLGSVNANDEAAAIHIETGAALNLTHGQTDTVKALFLGGVQVAAGTYGAPDNANVAAAFRTGLITGTGMLRVTSSPGSSGGSFQTWADANITNPAYAALKGPNDDPDRDGLTNFAEYAFGSDPQTAGGAAVQVQAGSGNLVVTWVQRDSGPAYVLQQSDTLAADSWTAVAGVTPVNAVDQTGVATGCTRKQATIPIAAGRRFLRVSASEG